MSFFRHARSIGPMAEQSNRGAEAPLLIVRDESHRLSLGGLLSSRARFRFAGCAQHAMKKFRQSSSFQQTATCGLTGCLSPGVHPSWLALVVRDFRVDHGDVHGRPVFHSCSRRLILEPHVRRCTHLGPVIYKASSKLETYNVWCGVTPATDRPR